jgi:hypothetical protein
MTVFAAVLPFAYAVFFVIGSPLFGSDQMRTTGRQSSSSQESWLRLSRADSAAVDNLGGWLTAVVGRVCLDMLRGPPPARI